TDQLTHGGPLADDLRIGADIRCRGRVLGQLAQIGEPADLVDESFPVEFFGDGHHIDRLVTRGEAYQPTEDEPMIMAIEVRVADQLRYPFPCGVIQHHPAEDRLLGFNGVRRYLEGRGLEVQFGTLGVDLITHGYWLWRIDDCLKRQHGACPGTGAVSSLPEQVTQPRPGGGATEDCSC